MKPLHSRVSFLLNMLKNKDKETMQHSCRVAKVAAVVAEEMGFKEKKYLARIRVGCLLHDVGKLLIPDEILFKESPLTEAEFKIIRQHTEFSKEIVDLFLPELNIGDMVVQHHEFFDGKGYPSKFKEDGICMEAKICSMADVFDTIRAGRFYQKGRNLQQTVEEIKRGAGTLYDPYIVEALERCAAKLEELFYLNKNDANKS